LKKEKPGEIAKERGLVTSTVYGHLAKMAELGLSIWSESLTEKELEYLKINTVKRLSIIFRTGRKHYRR
jgi:hypothetical protein